MSASQVEQIARVLTAKMSGMPGLDLPAIVSTVVADTVLILDGTLTVADFEQATPPNPPGRLPR